MMTVVIVIILLVMMILIVRWHQVGYGGDCVDGVLFGCVYVWSEWSAIVVY